MKNIVKEILNQIRADKERRRRSSAVLLVLSLFVASGVLWQLKITGITMTGEALCGNLEHQHTAECLGMKLVCGKEETAGHRHEDACYQQLVCEDAEHNHEDQCYVTAEQPVCGLEEADSHIHDDSCKKEGYVCGYETEHVHDLLCYSDPEADLETSSDWEKTIPALSRESAEDLAMVARTQIGYAESARNYKVGEDGSTKQGYTRYGEWYGNPYGDWNAMFVSFCLRYAEHPAYETLKNSGVETMRVAAERAGVYQAAAGTTPYVGDLAFLDKDSNGNCDTVAVVTERQEGSMTLVEGDCGGVVAENQYSLDNGTILGYALLTAQPATLEENAEEEIVEVDDVIASEAKNGDVMPAADGNITISFVISNNKYTADNGLTHVIVKLTEKNNPSADGYSTDGGLTYTHWTTEGGKYKTKITGTGTLMTRTIPVGTTLSGSSYSLPSISTTNITGSTLSYGSPYSWVTDTGMICNDKTEFTEDTTLYLYLYETGTSCGLNWVCNCDNGGSHSITYYVSGFASPTFTWGQSVSAPYIPTAEAVNSMYTGSQYCTAGPDHGMSFKEWYVIDSANNNAEVTFTSGLKLVEAYKDPNAENTIKVYARWEKVAAPVTVTATFVNGEAQTTETLNSGDALGDKLSAVTAPNGQIFLGWKIGETEDYATAETVIEADTTYTAVFAKKVTVSFVNGETTVETRELAENAVLGALPPNPEAAENQVFLGWQAEGAEGYATAETVITKDTIFRAAFATNVTVTFMNGKTQYGDVVKVPQGALVWEYLPETEPEYTGTSETPMAFSGWGWTVGEELFMVQEDTEAEGDLVLYAVFEEVTSYSIYLHDMAPDGVTDYETEGLDIQISQTALPVGQTLAQALAEDPYRMIHDDALASECIWYIKQADGTYAVYDLNAEVTSDLHLYTFNYSVTLTREEATAAASFLDLFAVASAVEVNVSDDGNTLTLTLREGEKPTAADFVVKGVDYTLYTWTYQEDGQTKPLNISEIIANGVTKNITATSSATDLAITANTNTQHIYFYVIVDQEKKLVQETNLTVYSFGNSDAKGRWRISEASLESIYSEYNLDVTAADQYKFAFCSGTNSDADIWNDVPLYEANGMQFVGLETSIVDNVYFYYLPNVNDQTSTGDVNDRTQWDDYKTTNTFYSVTISDSANLIYSEGEEVPAVQYVLTGGDATVTVKDPAEGNSAYWLVNGTKLAGGTSNNDGTTTYTFSNITEPIRITAYKDNMYDIRYDINLGSYTPTSTKPTINGGETYTEAIEVLSDGSYVVRTPSRTQFTVSGTNSLRTVIFTGWEVNADTNQRLNAGDTLTAEQLKQYGSSINLVAQWKTQPYTGSVSFYVNLKLEVIDYDGTSAPNTSDNNYTSALYGTTVHISPEPTSGYPSGNAQGEGGGVVLSDENTAVIDAQIRQFATGSVTASYGNAGDYIKREFSLGSFPDDEQILAKIRAVQTQYIADYEKWKQNDIDQDSDGDVDTDDYHAAAPSTNKIIAIDGKYIPVEEITSANYTIRWVVFKYDSTNGWHIDGTLVKKQGQITVNKTFYGHAEAIVDVKDNPYSITVKDAQRSTVATLNLNQKSDSNPTGWEKYDESTDTYTWVVPLTADKTYTFFENNYKTIVQAGGETVATLAEYMITNTANDVNRRDYDETKGVSVTAKAHSVDQDSSSYETVTFYNGYIPTAAVPISKVDDYGNPLTGVSFSLYRNDVKCTIYKDAADIYYIYKPTEGVENVNWWEVTSGLITVNEQGYAMVMGLKDVDENGNYSDYKFKLEETVAPEGYASIEDIEFEITENGSIQLQGTSGAALVDGNMIRVTNASKTMDITVVKNWEGEKEEVQIQLTQNGTPLVSKTVTLNDEYGWTYTWEDMPIYVSGAVAEYSVKETWIGNTAYQGNFDDGYENYIVVVSKPAAVDSDGDGLPESATITVNNSVYEGGLQFKKVDENGNALYGAGFQLFTDKDCETEYGIGEISDLYGNVNFGSLVAGTYYMKEVRTPAGYQDNDTVYKIVVSGNGTVITDMSTQKTVTAIENIQATASLKVQKVDGSSNALSGAVFEVHMKNGDGVYEKITRTVGGVSRNQFPVDDSGKLTVPDLMPGDYKLVEVSAPAGYYRMTEEIEFNVALAKIVALDVRTDENGNRVEDTTNSWSFDGETITVVNVTGSELPQTGGIGTHYGTMAGLLMMLSSLLYGFLLRRKRERGAV